MSGFMTQPAPQKIAKIMFGMVFSVLYFMAAMLVCLALWVHLPFGGLTYALTMLVAVLAVLSWLVKFNTPNGIKNHDGAVWLPRIFWLLAILVAVWLGMMQPSNDRNWNPEVAHIVDYEQNPTNPNLITIKNVRNFHWRSEHDYDVQWQNRTFDLNRLNSMDLVLSIWGNENIAHTFLTFGFDDGERIAFSVEIRKEMGEEFSSIGGFFRQFELSIIAADEKDIIFTRSNIRHESVYLYPLTYDKNKMKTLFLTYLQKGRQLNRQPAWYNTISSNCTTFIYQMVQLIDSDARLLPMDYRVLVSGRLPSYLIELGVIRPNYPPKTWKNLAFINPKVANDTADDISSQAFSEKIRQNLPTDTP